MDILIDGFIFSQLVINHIPLALFEKTIERIAPCKVDTVL